MLDVIKNSAKAIAGATASGVLSAGTALVVVPESVQMPWYGYIIVGAINAAIGFLCVYYTTNKPLPK